MLKLITHLRIRDRLIIGFAALCLVLAAVVGTTIWKVESNNAMTQRIRTEISALECVRTTLVAHVAGKPTLLSVDAGRKLIEQDVKPAFSQLEAWVNRYEEERDAA